MDSLLASFVLAAGPLNRLVTYGFLLAAVPLLGFVVLDLRRAAKEAAEKKKGSMRFMSRYRDEHGMPIFFEAGEDPSARAAHRVLTQKRRAGATPWTGDKRR
jgi:hypothetical protein